MNTKALHFDETIQSWDEALPLGNGDIGCLIWNSSDKLRFSLDKGGIWDCSDPPENQENFTYSDLKDLVSRGRQKAIVKKYDDCYGETTPTKLPTGKLILNLGAKENVISDLDFQTAQAVITAGEVQLKSFVHSAENYGMIMINKTGVSLSVQNPKFGSERTSGVRRRAHGTVQALSRLHYPEASFVKENEDGIEYQYFVQPTKDRFFGIITAKTESGGNTLIAYTVCVSKSDNFVQEGKDTVKNALSGGYDAAFNEHKIWWADYWGKSQITLPDKLLEKQWYLNNYLLGSCSRKGFLPMPLQGVWTADNDSLPPWKGDYHHDLNTQMSYTSYLKANRLEQGECFIDYLLSLAQVGERFAKKFYGANGLCLPSVMDVEGHALGGWSQYALSPTNQLWLCQIMARYYFHTGDREYLQKIHSYMQAAGSFLMSILKEENGVYKLPLSSSPEIYDNSLKAWLTPNSNYDLALMRSFASDMAALCREVGDSVQEKLWLERLEKFEPLAVDKNDVLMLDSATSPFESHRHHSHCMSIYPLKTLEYTIPRNKKIIDATVNDLERHGIKNWVGYSVGWMAQFYIVQGNGERACAMLRDFFNYNCTKNGFHINGDYMNKTDFSMKYRLFTLEGNFIAADAIQEMLLYSERGKIRLFPAVPKSWKEVGFDNFRGFGGVLVSGRMTDGKISYISITATADCAFSIENDLKHLCPDIPVENAASIVLKKGEKLIFQMN
ncbi:MAG: hypothetical protein GX851_07505 [Clostridiales bacterium]|nr:hypothetical protein [Clostridiales bacterium]